MLQHVEFTVNPLVAEIAVRLADEGVPIRAIARATKTPSEDVRTVLHEAKNDGRILDLPKEDWPAKANREDRIPVINTLLDNPNEFMFAAKRVFKTTKMQALVLMELLRRNQASREEIHHVTSATSSKKQDETEIKIVDVVICHLRKKMKPYNLPIKTVWGCGYYIEKDDRKRAIELLSKPVDDNYKAPAGVVEIIPEGDETIVEVLPEGIEKEAA